MSTLVVCITNTVRRLSRTVNSITNTVRSEGSPELSMTSSYQVVKNMERNADRQPLLKVFDFHFLVAAESYGIAS